ncbi:MAG: acetolactate synthase small subunit [Dethiobacter sp.]|nr:acetolactate synthase small subunit [Dethiobacter sp.]
MRKILDILVEDVHGVLTRVLHIINRHRCNVQTISAGHPLDTDLTRIYIVLEADSLATERVIKQLGQQINILSVTDVSGKELIEQEIMLIKVSAKQENRESIQSIADMFEAEVLEVAGDYMLIELTGQVDKLDTFVGEMQKYCIKDMARSGSIFMLRESASFDSQHNGFCDSAGKQI